MKNVTITHLFLKGPMLSPVFSTNNCMKIKHSLFSQLAKPVFFGVKNLDTFKTSFTKSLAPIYVSSEYNRQYFTGKITSKPEIKYESDEIIFDNCIFQITSADTALEGTFNGNLVFSCCTFNLETATLIGIAAGSIVVSGCFIRTPNTNSIIAPPPFGTLTLQNNLVKESTGYIVSNGASGSNPEPRITMTSNNFTSSKLKIKSSDMSNSVIFKLNAYYNGQNQVFCDYYTGITISYCNFIKNSADLFSLTSNYMVTNCVFAENTGLIATSLQSPFGYQYTLSLIGCAVDKTKENSGAVSGSSDQFGISAPSPNTFKYANEDPKCPTYSPTPDKSPEETPMQTPAKSPDPTTPPQTDNIPPRTPEPSPLPPTTPPESPVPSRSPVPTNSPKPTVNAYGLTILLVPLFLFIIIIPLLVLVMIRLVREMSSNDAAMKNNYQRFFSDEGSSSSDRPDPLDLRKSSSDDDGDLDVFTVSPKNRERFMPKKSNNQTKAELIYGFMN